MLAKSHLFQSDETLLHTLCRVVHECLTQNILPFWLNNMLDTKRGGWYGRMTGKGQIEENAPRGAILYARLLWTFSAAYRVLDDSACLEAARLTKDYILAHFMDEENGGSFWSVTSDAGACPSGPRLFSAHHYEDMWKIRRVDTSAAWVPCGAELP